MPMTAAQITAELTRKAKTPGSAAPIAKNKAQYDSIVKQLGGSGGANNNKIITNVPYSGPNLGSDMSNSDDYQGGGVSLPGSNGGTAAGGSGLQTVPGSGAMTAASPLSGFGYGDLFKDAAGYKAKLDAYMNTDFKYDYTSDPTFIAAQQLARAGADTASKNTMETMNDRGLLQSSVTNSQLGQIKQNAEMEPLKLIPQLQSQARADRNSQMQMLYNMYSGEMNAGQQSYQFEKTFPLQEAAVKGRYIDGEAEKLIQTIMAGKTGYKDASPEQRVALNKSATDARNQLIGMGYDAEGLFGSGVTTDQARQNIGKASQLTASMQAALLSSLQGTAQATGFWPQNTGGVFNQMPLFKDLAPVYKGMEGKPTMDHEKFTKEMALIGLKTEGEKLSQIATAQNQDYSKWLHENNIDEATAKKETNKFKSDILAMVGKKDTDKNSPTYGQFIDRDLMMQYYAKRQKYMVDNGILIDEIMDAINKSAVQPNKYAPPDAAGSGSYTITPIPKT